MRFTAEMDALIRLAGEMALIDGLNAGGYRVNFGSLPSIFMPQFNQCVADQQEHVLNFALAVINASDDDARTKIAERQELWLNKALMEFYYLGMLLADSHQRLKWRVGPTEHCTTCIGVDGQVHTAQQWLESGIFPRSSRLECGGYKCQCTLEVTDEPLSGNFVGLALQPGQTYQPATVGFLSRFFRRLF